MFNWDTREPFVPEQAQGGWGELNPPIPDSRRGWDERTPVLRNRTMADYPAGELSTEDLPKSGGIIGGLARVSGLMPVLESVKGIPQKPGYLQDVLPDVLGWMDFPAKEATSVVAAAPIMYKTRPWLRDIVGKVAGKEWLEKWSQNQPGNLVDAGHEMFRDYLRATGNKMANLGTEVEGLALDFMPEKSPMGYWEIKPEVAMGSKKYHSYTVPGEIVTKGAGVSNLQELYNALYDYNKYIMGDVSAQGGKPMFNATLSAGGGGHVSGSRGDVISNPELMKRTLLEYIENEPLIYPSVPGVKNKRRTYVEPTQSHYESNYDFDEVMEGNGREQTWRNLPYKGQGALAARGNVGAPDQRFELRAPYAPFHVGQVAENMLLMQAIFDMAEAAKKTGKPMPLNISDLESFMYENIYRPNKEKILEAQMKGHPGNKGVHEGWSPILGHLRVADNPSISAEIQQLRQGTVAPRVGQPTLSPSHNPITGEPFTYADLKNLTPNEMEVVSQHLYNGDADFSDIMRTVQEHPGEQLPTSLGQRLNELIPGSRNLTDMDNATWENDLLSRYFYVPETLNEHERRLIRDYDYTSPWENRFGEYLRPRREILESSPTSGERHVAGKYAYRWGDLNFLNREQREHMAEEGARIWDDNINDTRNAYTLYRTSHGDVPLPYELAREFYMITRP